MLYKESKEYLLDKLKAAGGDPPPKRLQNTI